MKNILLAWELGGGLGHVANLLPLAEQLHLRGATIHLALRDLSMAHRVFAKVDGRCWQAPAKCSRPKQGVSEPRTFADILFNCGFGDAQELHALVRGWLNIFRAVQPDMVLAEHSPAALLAAQIAGCRVVMVGTGFCCPPADQPWRDLRPWSPRPAQQLAAAHGRVLAHVNEVLRREGSAPLTELAHLFRTKGVCLLTVPPLDPYAPRSAAHYHAAWPHWGGKEPTWPTGDGKRLFAYLKPFPALPQLLSLLAELRQPTIVVCDGIDLSLQKRFVRPWLTFENEPLDMRAATTGCDAAICNANHGTTLALLAAGKPGLYLPLHLEQTLTAFAVRQLGAGAMASVRRPEQIAIRLMEVLRSAAMVQAAQQLAARLQGYDHQCELQSAVATIDFAATVG